MGNEVPAASTFEKYCAFLAGFLGIPCFLVLVRLMNFFFASRSWWGQLGGAFATAALIAEPVALFVLDKKSPLVMHGVRLFLVAVPLVILGTCLLFPQLFFLLVDFMGAKR
ncbi:MAG TPA: hypothetical protein P5110_02710 [Candidatus Omnitrophota bacterium]|nr:hypothetical protein [Candidatus Omnitrophota bacterium]HRZ14399.1 hypothetical protein [Candidatus Omnitrophota bacterium]